ncbi:hypothetical protein A9Q83_11690 [Alphaproteobacteria bacterium 46_93_T64]|nr:hypothetical protein A9Q83_11690 [Alphaproteobacteria bacterium 46_93_T64]
MKLRTTKSVRLFACSAIVASGAILSGITPAVSATYLPDYMVIATGQSNSSNNNVGNPLHLSTSELGAIGANGAVSPPGSVPSIPGAHGSSRASSGITYDGDVAITETNGVITSSNSHVYSANTGAGNQGTQGIDCAGSYNTCTDSGSQISSNNKHGTPGPTLTNLGNNKGVQGGFAAHMADLKTEAQTLTTDYWNLAATDTFGFEKIDGNRLDVFGSGDHVIDLGTKDKFLLQNGTWTISGAADTTVIFRLVNDSIFDISQANLVVGGAMGLNNVLFLVDGKDGTGSFTFNNVFFNGMSFWDYGGQGEKNEAVWNNVAGCGQVMTDKINFNNVSMTGCEFNPTVTVVPLPAAFPLYGAGIAIMGFIGWRKKRRAA